ncbi:hypothetical protein H2200_001831 [Cladophialophora chaetospira]|uniref:Uncharacterized protein n=1 Tax=Cladophialophora chaetospira TaxID=386627 RepID=A0AA38XLM6_9EURO|nr:hypothetical protein H2200_001831 [Cladophialophora chaetospira]
MAQYAPFAPSAEWHHSLSNQHRGNILTHSKRKADDELESQSHISSHFKKLRLNQTQNQNLVNHQTNGIVAQTHTPTHHYPVPAVSSPPPTRPTVSFRPHIANTDARPALDFHHLHPGIDHHDFALSPPAYHEPITYSPPPPPQPTPAPLPDTDFMTIDETPNRIIIHDLSSEIAEIEAEEARHNATLFLSDLDKKVSALPQHLLQSQNHDRNSHFPRIGLERPPENLSTALVLYRDPSSISVPEEEDVVRKTIIEARKRAREKTAVEQRERERLQREAETRALQEHWDEGMIDHSYRGVDDMQAEEEDDFDEDLDPMDIE